MPVLWPRVALPDHWSGALARAVTLLLGVPLILGAVLARPPSWAVELCMGQRWPARVVLVLVVYLCIRVAQTVVFSLLPRAPLLWMWHVWLPWKGQRLRILQRDVARLHVERRPLPAGDVFVIELRDGREVELSPTHWIGATALFARLQRIVSGASPRPRPSASQSGAL